MESLNNFINDINNISEAFKLSDNNFVSKNDKYKYFPKDKEELRKLLEERITKDPDADLNDIDVSKITDMYQLFWKLDPHDIDVSNWDVKNVENMHSLFYECKNFNCDLSNWDVSNVENMSQMFCECRKFEGKGLEDWDVSKVTNMRSMFSHCIKINIDFSNWNISKVEDMSYMFYCCYAFKGKGLENWKIDSLKNFRWMFENCTIFCANLKKWKVTHKMNFNKDLFKTCPQMKNKSPLWVYMYG